MDRVAGAVSRWNVDAIKEPKGFIKFIQIIIAIFAFATTCSMSSSSSFHVACLPTGSTKAANETITTKFSYPFRLYDCDQKVPICAGNNQTEGTECPHGDYSAPSQFYVFVGVIAFLYSIGAVILYVCFEDKYRENDRIPVVDFIVSAVIVVLWLISSAAWADGVSKVKFYTDPSELITAHYADDCTAAVGKCTPTSYGNFASLNVSIIFGFLNMCVWGGNLWFLYKETKWFKVEPDKPELTTPQSTTPQTPQSI